MNKTKPTLAFALLTFAFAASLQAASIDATRTSIDAIVGFSDTSGPGTGYFTPAGDDGDPLTPTDSSTTLIGGTGSRTSQTRFIQNLVYRYELPTLPAGEIIDSFTFNYQIYAGRDYSDWDMDLDVYLLNVDDPTTTGTDFYYNGDNDTSNALVGSSYVATDTSSTTYTPPVDVSFTVDSGTALTLLQSFYGGDETPDQTEATFRFNLDHTFSNFAYNRYYVTSGDTTSGFTLNTAAPAAAFYWDGPTVDTTNGASDGGDGTWDTTTTNWDGAAWNNANNDIATFGGTAGTVTLGEDITVGGLQFDAAGYLIQDNGGGETLTFGTAGNIAANQNAEISATVAGSSDITKTGAGTLTLSGDNTFTAGLIVDEGSLILSGANGFTGGLTINNAGRVELGDPGALNSTAGSENAVTFGAGGTSVLSLNGNSAVVKSLDSDTTTPGTPVVENGSATTAAILTIGNSTNQASTFAGTIRDGGDAALSLVKAGTGQLTLSGTNSFTGGVDISGGTLEVTKDSFGSGDITFSGDGTLRKVRNGGGASRPFPATGDVGIDSGVTAAFAGNSYYYSYHIGGVLSGDDTTTAIVSVGSGTDIRFDSVANTFAGAFQVDGTGGATVNSLADSTQRLYISAGGRFILGSAGAALTFDNRPIQIGNNAYIINNASSADSTITMAQDLNATISNNSRTLYLGGSNTGDNTFAGVIGDSSNGTGKVSLYKQDSGTWILTGANTYSGTTTIGAGTLEIGTGGQVGTGAVTNNASLVFNSEGDVVVNSAIDGTGSILQSGSGTVTLNDSIADTIAAITVNAGTLEYNGATSVDITVNNGTLAGTGSLGTVDASGATLGIGGDGTVGTITVDQLLLSDGSVINWEFDGATGDLIDVSFADKTDGVTDLDLSGLTPGSDLITIAITALGAKPVKGQTYTLFGGEVSGFDASLFAFEGAYAQFWEISEGSLILTSTIPEPSTMVLAGLGLAGLTLRRRRRK